MVMNSLSFCLSVKLLISSSYLNEILLGTVIWVVGFSLSSLSVCWKFVVPLYCGGSSLWVGLDEWLVKVSWLGKLVSVFRWVELDIFSLECNECPVVSFECLWVWCDF